MPAAAVMPHQEVETDRSLLIVDTDKIYARHLARAMSARDFNPTSTGSISSVKNYTNTGAPAYAIVELRLHDGNGLEVVEHLQSLNPDCQVVVLTSYGSFETAVAAIKLGALNYLTKPVEFDVVHAALSANDDASLALPENLMTAKRVRWEHITRTLELCGNNVSETARQLSMHRRTLQRLLAEGAPV